jgi:hypothetical protein
MSRTLMTAAAFAGLIVMSGCAVRGSESASIAHGSATNPELICTFEAPTGTNFKTRRCMTKDEADAARETAQRTADSIRTPPPDVRQ